MLIEINFTESEMITFLENRGYRTEYMPRFFDSSDMFSLDSQLEERPVLVIFDYKDSEITVPDEKNYHSKWSLLKETFTKELKKSLLKI